MEQASLFGAPPSQTKHFPAVHGLQPRPSSHTCSSARAGSRRNSKRYEFYQPLRDRTLAMVSRRRRRARGSRSRRDVSARRLGDHLTTGDSQLGRAEPIEDTARVISRMVDVVMIRTYEQTKIEAPSPAIRGCR
jgi:ornithine carbamoyltransferase